MRQAIFHRHRLRASYRNVPMDFVLGLLDEDEDYGAAEDVPRRELRRRLRQEGRR